MRVRFAPSPTGALHIGGARTALFNWLLARHSGGELVLRIEDTDRERSTPENVEQILDALRWLELDWDEGPILQSERAERHREALAGAARVGARATARAPPARTSRRSRSATATTVASAASREDDGAVRLRVPDDGATVVHDLVRGDTRFEHVHLDDPVIARADGSPLYNFAVAIDDLDAGITHVVRGKDHLSNTPKQLLVIEAARAVGLHTHAPPPHTRTCRCCTDPTARSSQSATARPRCRSCATPATCPRRCATTSRCSAGAPAMTRRCSAPRS